MKGLARVWMGIVVFDLLLLGGAVYNLVRGLRLPIDANGIAYVRGCTIKIGWGLRTVACGPGVGKQDVVMKAWIILAAVALLLLYSFWRFYGSSIRPSEQE